MWRAIAGLNLVGSNGGAFLYITNGLNHRIQRYMLKRFVGAGGTDEKLESTQRGIKCLGTSTTSRSLHDDIRHLQLLCRCGARDSEARTLTGGTGLAPTVTARRTAL